MAPGLWRLELPSRTLPPYRTTNSYLIAAEGGVWIVDPGFEGAEGLEALERARSELGLGPPLGALLTHHHSDHRAGLPAILERHPELPVLAHLRALEVLAEERLPLRPRALAEGHALPTLGGPLEVLATPGHSTDSLTFVLPDASAALVGDLLAGGGSSWIGRPEGSVRAYLASLRRLEALRLDRIGPGHGPSIEDPQVALRDARQHRLGREGQLLAALTEGARTVDELRAAVYPRLDGALHDHAERSILAHLDALIAEGRVVGETAPGRGRVYTLIG